MPFSFRFVAGFLVAMVLGVTLAVDEVCYGKYGCFNNRAPFDRSFLFNFLPKPPAEIQTTFYLFTRQDRIGFATLDDSDTSKLEDSSYDGTKKTILIAHGWTGKPLESTWVKDMKQAFLDKEDVNVIIVGWKEGASSLFYPQAVANSRLVGAQVAEFIKFLNEQTGNTPDSFHVVGFSLGAQVSGYAGKRFKDLTNKKIARITGLDPAAPGYEEEHIDVRLDSTDAAFVDVIHTDAPNIGTPDKSGHFDFWPNGGRGQPGCLIKKKRSHIMRRVQRGDKRSLVNNFFSLVGCEHYRAHQYYIESIKATKTSFVSYRCDSMDNFRRAKCVSCTNGCPEMGYNAVKYKNSPSGNFYLMTNSKSPFTIARYVEITFKTGNSMWYADGDNPGVMLYGSEADSSAFEIDADLDAGSTKKFVAPLKLDLGTLEKIAVKNDQWTYWDKWELIKVSVKYLDSDQRYTACYNMAVKGKFIEKPLTRGDTTCKRKHVIRDHTQKLRTAEKKTAKNSDDVTLSLYVKQLN